MFSDRRFKIPERLIRKIIKSVLDDHNTSGSLSIILTNSARMSKLHYQFMGDDSPTDVLSFNLAENESTNYIEGEVYVDLQTAANQAEQYAVDYVEEVARLCVHGTLHLLGYDDLKVSAKKVMWRAQESIIDKFFQKKDN